MKLDAIVSLSLLGILFSSLASTTPADSNTCSPLNALWDLLGGTDPAPAPNTPEQRNNTLGVASQDSDPPELDGAPLDWDTAVQKGRSLYQALQIKINANPTPWDNQTARALFYKPEYGKVQQEFPLQPSCWFIPFLTYMGVPADWNFRWFKVSRWVDAVQEEKYDNWFRAARVGPNPDGTIVAYDIKRNGGPLHWSDATYYAWEQFTFPQRASLQSLRYIVQHNVLNADTASIMNQAYTKNELEIGAYYRWTPADEAFYAFLGTPNGNGVPHLLNDHYLALGKLDIKSIETVAGNQPNAILDYHGQRILTFLGFTLQPASQTRKSSRRELDTTENSVEDHSVSGPLDGDLSDIESNTSG